MRSQEPKRCLRQQDKWSDLFNPFFAECNDFWKEFDKDPQFLEAYEICQRMMDTWTPHTVDHAATYYQRKRDSNLEDIEKCRDMVFPNISRNKSAPRTQRRRGSYGDLEGGITGQSRHKQHQISAEDLMTKKRTRRHSASESTNTVIIKRNPKEADINYEQRSDDSPTQRASRKLAKIANGGISESREIVMAFRGKNPKWDGPGPNQELPHVAQELDVDIPSDRNRKSPHLATPIAKKTSFPRDTNLTSMDLPGRKLTTITEESQESTSPSSRTAPYPNSIPPTGRTSLLFSSVCSPRVWRMMHGLPSDDEENDADNEKSEGK